MHSILDTFLGNMTTIIAFMFIALKLKELIITRIQISSYLLLLTPILVSLLSMLIMHHPLEYNGMRIDLRGVPLYFISYVMGWK
ncbi:diguanylate cyclase [Oceanobacillus limi]|uniref:Diguanylate cyclase n=1 Tax=Oceanobacillus limi TaxID=930131 RepID=A0A1I0FEY7_9BACI|nr:hypothetical protein [Oceanobacillus limi]SET56730.1 diguanylate cyclase [Oceanobacillus limi]